MKKLFSPLFEEFENERSSGGSTTIDEAPVRGIFSQLSDDFDDETETTEVETPIEPEVTEPVVEKPLTRAELDAVLSQRLPEPVSVQPILTQEELDVQLGRYRPNQKLIATLLSNEVDDAEKLAVLEEMTQGIYKYSTNTANQLAQYYVEQLRTELAPVMTAAQQTQAKTWEEEFYKENPILKGQDALVQAASAQLKTSGVVPKTKEEAFKMVAETAVNIGRQVNPEFGQPKKVSRMATVSTGGQRGIAPASGASKRGAADIWG